MKNWLDRTDIKATILDLLDGGMSSASQFVMTCDIRGIEITTDFIGCLLELIRNDDVFKIVKHIVERGMFSRCFREKSIISLILFGGMHNTRLRWILDNMSNTHPGLIVGTYLKLEHRPIPSILEERVDQFVISLSNRLAKGNTEYLNTYHRKVVEIYERNRNLQHAMN